MPILITLFLSAFTSATLLPGSSEAVLVGVLANNAVPVGLAILVATIGNTLGSCVNWVLGRYFAHFRDRRWFPLDEAHYERYARWYRKWGLWSLLASWLPVIGDPLTVLAGIARTPIGLFVIIVFMAKAVRYMVVAGLVSLLW